jgi:phenylacetyl-CoA:acceptor oxidoreductase subunit 2
MKTTSIPYGPRPWPQSFWDARAAANFACGGMGAGLVVAAALSGARGAGLAVPLVVGLALVACGLLSVFAEVGRPLRAARVIRNPGSSWMSREALVAPLLFACALAGATGRPAFVAAAALLALGFVYCQGRMVHAARGIPAWRAPLVPWLFVATGLAEGFGLWHVVAVFTGARAPWLAVVFGALLVARIVLWRRYRHGLGQALQRDAAAALDRAGRVLLWGGTLLPLALVAPAAVLPGRPWLAVAGGLAAAAAGAWLKSTLVLRAGHNQGFAIAHLPVRGVRS